MGTGRAGAILLVCTSLAWAWASPAVAAHPGGHHRTARRPAQRNARPATGKPKAKVWTVSEYSKGKLHKLKAGSSYYGLIVASSVSFEKPQELHGFKWIEQRGFTCPVGAAFGKLKSNGVAQAEISLEKITGPLALESHYCVEGTNLHPEESLEQFEPWIGGYLKLTGLPGDIKFEGAEFGPSYVTMAPAGAFELEFKNFHENVTCKYFQLKPMHGDVSPQEAGSAGPLHISFAADMPTDTFNSSCASEAFFDFTMISYVGEYGPAMFAKYG